MDDAATNGPSFEFETVLTGLVERAQELVSTQSRMRDLIRINHELTSNLDLPDVLRRIVEIGKELLDARYAAMGVIGSDRRLEQFIHAGMDEEVRKQIDHLPEGKGLLGALIDDPRPVRLETIGADARSSGFPAHHPPMQSFLGVPIKVRDEVYGNLYLTDSQHGPFTRDDEELAQALAATAGVAIENARLFDDAQYRARWSSALAETARRLMLDDDEDHLNVIVDQVRDLTQSDLVIMALITEGGEQVVIDRAAGDDIDDLLGQAFSLAHTFAGRAIAQGDAILVGEDTEFEPQGLAHHALLGNSMIIPFGPHESPRGVLAATRGKGRLPFNPRDIDLGKSFASHVSVALDRAESQRTRRRVALLEDRGRIARDLHDHVIQRLFATGLSLQGIAAVIGGTAADQISAQVDELDGAIAQIRTTIFAMQHEPEHTGVSLRARVLEIVDRISDRDGVRPRVTFFGPVDLMTSDSLTDDVAAVVTEALSNAVRHAEATTIQISVTADSGRVSVEVTDDGVGLGESGKQSGLANLRRRADLLGGTFTVEPAPSGGTRVVWSVPG